MVRWEGEIVPVAMHCVSVPQALICRAPTSDRYTYLAINVQAFWGC